MKNSIFAIIIALLVGICIGIAGSQLATKNIDSETDPVALIEQIKELQLENATLKAKLATIEINSVKRNMPKKSRRYHDTKGAEPKIMHYDWKDPVRK